VTTYIHICEVCGAQEILTPEEAYQEGWDYPPRFGEFTTVSPRTCPNCPITKTLWWAMAMEKYTPDMLNEDQKIVLMRILGEPESITPEST